MTFEEELAAGVFAYSQCLFCGHKEEPPTDNPPICCEQARAAHEVSDER
jgi:hypothetical protein